MDFYKVQKRLKQIQDELHGSNNFTSETMARVEKLAKEIEPLAVELFGEEDEVTGELESAILISKQYNPNDLEQEVETIKRGLRHLEYGIALFLDNI